MSQATDLISFLRAFNVPSELLFKKGGKKTEVIDESLPIQSGDFLISVADSGYWTIFKAFIWFVTTVYQPVS